MKSLLVLNRPTLPPPAPAGWFVVAFSEELKKGQVLTRRIVGQDLVLFRTESGQAAAMDPYCPHLGAHLGHGGTVQGETIRCPFHAFCFDTQGTCVSTPYGTKPPPRAKARVWPIQEKNGVIMVFHDAAGAQPGWEVPTLDMNGWTPLLWHRWNLRGHPQETSENSVDLGHFIVVHGYESVKFHGAAVNGSYFNTKVGFERPRSFINGKGSIAAEIDVHVHGLGYSYVDVWLPKLKLATRQFVLSTPTDSDHIDLQIAMSIREDFKPSAIHPALALLPRALVRAILTRASFWGYKEDVKQDFAMWTNKAYIAPPALAEGDGPVGKYRVWARQFYPDATPPTREMPPSPVGTAA